MLVTLKARGTISVSRELRQRLGITAGDPLEAKVERGRLILTPVQLVPRQLELSGSGKAKEAEASRDVKRGRVRVFARAADLLKDLGADR